MNTNLLLLLKNNKNKNKNTNNNKIIINNNNKQTNKHVFTLDNLTKLGVYGLSFIFYRNHNNIDQAKLEIKNNMYREMFSTSNKDIIVIVTEAGLCNRLRTIFTYYRKAIIDKKKLIVIWNVNKVCPGFFLEYFEPIENITFFESNVNNYSIDYIGIFGHPDFTNYKIYSDLKILPAIKEKVNSNIDLLNNNYISIHVRRTDFITPSRNLNYDFYEKFLNDNNTYNIYIATDNRETQNYFIKKYEDRIKIINLIDNNVKTTRHTTLENSIIDIYTCVYSSKFLGTPGSSFSELIYRLQDELIIKKYITL